MTPFTSKTVGGLAEVLETIRQTIRERISSREKSMLTSKYHRAFCAPFLSSARR